MNVVPCVTLILHTQPTPYGCFYQGVFLRLLFGPSLQVVFLLWCHRRLPLRRSRD